LPPRHNEVAAGQEAVNPAAADRRVIPTVDRTLMDRVVMSTDPVVMSSSEVVSTTHSGDRFIRMRKDIRTGMDIRMGIRMGIRTGRTIIRRPSRVA